MDFTPQKITVFRALQLGDLLCSVPALRSLRKAYPEAKITLIGLPWAKTFVERFSHYLDDFLEFPGYPGLPEVKPELQRIPEFFTKAQQRKFDLALQMHGSGAYVNSITALLGAKVTAGYYLENEYCPDPDHFMFYPKDESEIWRQLRLMQFLELPYQGEDLEFPLTFKDHEEFLAIDPAFRPRTFDYVCIHPGARWLSRRWDPERFARVADAIAAQGYEVVITGSKEETALAGKLAKLMERPSINMAGKTTLGALAYLLRRAKLLVCNDTGVSHLAAALGVRSVVLVMGSDPSRWAPLDTNRHRALFHPMDCRPCGFWECPIGHPCSAALTADEALEAAQELLRETADL